ncbi:MAG TPA: HAMP domain-containing sensor histidine kinase [Streptosporangiaceae bacterium]|nr:HAMP domain-containing sensor histidine kinase [Streptosporangiaceae bacterium]
MSLRARMLILLIAVTTVFLIIMGVVTAVIVTTRISNAFNSELKATANHSVVQLANVAGDYDTAYISRRTGQVGLVSPSSATGNELVTALRELVSKNQASAFLGSRPRMTPFTISLPGGPKVRAVWRLTAGGTNNRSPLPPGRNVLVVARPADVVRTQVDGVIIAELITGGALVALLAIGGGWLIRRGLAPLDQMASTANEITSRGDLTARVAEADDRTEVGRLGSAINTMLDRIQQAFGARLRSEQKVREFAADASHELRTPLTTIRGYAELYRQGALGPDQLPNAMRRIEQEAQRMSTLVAELLELARLDRTSSLDLTETDLAGVVRDAVADAVAVEPGRPVRAEAPPRLVAVVDEPRIRQVLANLLGNVRAHTPVTTPVAVRLGALTGGVLLEVADAGPGMSDEDAARAFDRFHRAPERADGGGEAGADGGDEARGSGLGLSIVQAISHAHGGQATLESWPRRGTRVRIWLPTRAAPS